MITKQPRQGTFAKDKNDILFSRFGINYNDIDPRFRKGSIVLKETVGPILIVIARTVLIFLKPPQVLTPERPEEDQAAEKSEGNKDLTTPTTPSKQKKVITALHCDIIQDEFWNQRPHLLE
jgi:tRNA(His) guanylyltransferase